MMNISVRKPIKEGQIKTASSLSQGQLVITDVKYIGVGRGFKLHFCLNGENYKLVKSNGEDRVFIKETAALKFAADTLNINNVGFDLSNWNQELVYDYYRESKKEVCYE